MAVHGSVGEFVQTKKSWAFYTERLDQFFAAIDVENTGKKSAILLSSCGQATYQTAKDLFAPDKPSEKTYTVIFDKLMKHFCPALQVPQQNTQAGREYCYLLCRAEEILRILCFRGNTGRYAAKPPGSWNRQLSNAETSTNRRRVNLPKGLRLSHSHGNGWQRFPWPPTPNKDTLGEPVKVR